MGKRGRGAEAAGGKRRPVLQLDNSIRKDREAAAAAAAGAADSATALSVAEPSASRLAGGLVLLGAYADSDDDDEEEEEDTGPQSPPLERPRDLDSKVADFLAEIDAISVPGPTAEGDGAADGESGLAGGADGDTVEASATESISGKVVGVSAETAGALARDRAQPGGWHYDTHYSTASTGIEMGEWQEVWDENTGCYYYWHLQTNQVTWELPSALALQIQHLQHLNNGHFPGVSETGATEGTDVPGTVHPVSSVEEKAQTKPITSTIVKPREINERVCALTSEDEGRSVGVAESLLASLIPESVRQAEARWRQTLHGPGSPSSPASLSAPPSPAVPSHQPGGAAETEPSAGGRRRTASDASSGSRKSGGSSGDGVSDKEDDADDGRNDGGDDEEDSDQELKHILETKRAELRALEDGGGSSRSSTPRRDDPEDVGASAAATEPKPKWKTFVRAASPPPPPARAATSPERDAHDAGLGEEEEEEAEAGHLEEGPSSAAGSVKGERSPEGVQGVDPAGAVDTGDEEEEDEAGDVVQEAEDGVMAGKVGAGEDDDDDEEEERESETPASSHTGVVRSHSRAPGRTEEARRRGGTGGGGGGGGRVDPEDDDDQVKRGHLDSLQFVIAELANDLTSKLGFLGISTRAVSNFQLLLLTTQTRLADWREGSLDSRYLKRRLQEGAAQLAQYECNATPKGWACTWDRTHARYYYTNERTGASQWEFPDVTDEGVGEENDAGRGEGPVGGVSVETPDWLTLNRPLMTDAFAAHVEQPSMSASLRDVPLLPPPALAPSSLASYSKPLAPLAALQYALPAAMVPPYPLAHAPPAGPCHPSAPPPVAAPPSSAPPPLPPPPPPPPPPAEPLPPPPPESPPPPPPPPESPPPPPPPLEDDDIEEVDMQLETGAGEPPPPGVEEPAPPLPPPLKAGKAPLHTHVLSAAVSEADPATGKDEAVRAGSHCEAESASGDLGSTADLQTPHHDRQQGHAVPPLRDPLVAMVPGAWGPGEPLSSIVTTIQPPSITMPTHSALPSGPTLATNAVADKAKKTKKLKKVSGKVKGKMPPLVQKWKSIQRELEEEERGSSSDDGEPQDPTTRIINWRHEQMLTGKSERNANFEALPEDWRERLKRRKMNPR
ncbi:formin-binding protein 4 [Lethenteron reissneri]|uniref:formin-binding protein 4 n=1 Tax=Lethenteron reissneri TaxID=7753 RepID=UPI002AB6EF3E|nr:formin-binding protein 4 [Lethenteron reissneri]